MTDLQFYLLVPLAPLAGAIVAGLGGRTIGRSGAHWVTIIGVAISFAASCMIFLDVLDGAEFNGPVYTWLVSDGTRFEIGFLIDRLSALMMVVVTFVSLMVHIYTIGYMADDPGYQRFFAYIALFVGAMGKSTQFPMQVWLPDSMEGLTLMSALIHAAPMVTARIFMVARMSPLFEHSQTALSFVLVIGGITAFFMALIAVVQYDIKRVVAYSTLSQLGYMTVALGASAYSTAIFHLMTHAFFKALLFLGAGSVIIALHHEQDMRRMGGLRGYMPWTYGTVLIGAIASVGVPGFAGFFSKDAIIEAVQLSKTPGAGFAWLAVTACVFVTAFYTFRLVFYAFHGKERFGPHDHAPHESPAVVTVPLVLLAIPSICAGWLIGPVLFGDYFGGSISIASSHAALRGWPGH